MRVSLRQLAIHHQGMGVLHERMPQIAGQHPMDVRLAGQQSVGIRAGAMELVAEPDSTEVAPGPLPAILCGPKSPPRP
jgi:hypothetical protein